MKLVIGLGNPGKEYQNTRHNIGFQCIDYLIKNLNLGLPKIKFNAEVWKYSINNEKYIFAKPLSYMNLSGKPSLLLATYFEINKKDIIVIYDDKDLDFLNLKIKLSGSAGGHNGMKSIIENFKSDQIARIKVGIGYSKHYLIKDWVLANFSFEEQKELSFVYKKILQIFEKIFIGESIEKIAATTNSRR